MNQPVVSVVMASYNSSEHIAAAIYSVLMQSIGNIELIVVDDASVDNSPQIIDEISESDQRVRSVRAPRNGGPAAARNLALSQVRGRWIAIMDSDDLMLPDRLERMISSAEDDNVDIVADNLMHFWGDGSFAPSLHLDLSQPITIDAVELVKNATRYGYLKAVLRSERLGHIRYNERLTVGEDFDYYLRGLQSGSNLRIYPMAGYFYRERHRVDPGAVQQRKDIYAMAEALNGFSNELARSSPLYDACKKRADEFRSEIKYLDFIAFLKEKKFLIAAQLALINPAVVPRLQKPIKARLERLRRFLKIKSAASAAPNLQNLVNDMLIEIKRFDKNFLG